MNNPIEVIQIDQTNRYALYYDEYGYDYLKEWEWSGLGVATLSIARNLRILELELDDHNDQIREIMEYAKTHEDIYPAIAKHLDRAGFVYEFVSLQGYSQSEWAEVVVFTDPDRGPRELTGFIEEFRAWFRGDVYVVAWEELVVYTAPNGQSIERWEPVEAVSQTIFTKSWPFNAENCAQLLGALEIVKVA